MKKNYFIHFLILICYYLWYWFITLKQNCPKKAEGRTNTFKGPEKMLHALTEGIVNKKASEPNSDKSDLCMLLGSSYNSQSRPEIYTITKQLIRSQIREPATEL